jgi:hypothetical protein
MTCVFLGWGFGDVLKRHKVLNGFFFSPWPNFGYNFFSFGNFWLQGFESLLTFGFQQINCGKAYKW